MNLSQLTLKNYRNYENAILNFNNKINIIIGDNAQGKTNILEAIYFLAITKSYRTSDDVNLIRTGTFQSVVSAKAKINGMSKKISITFNKNTKKIVFNNNPVKKLSEFIGVLKIVLMAPEDIDIIKGSPSIRRNFLNIELSKMSKDYINKYNEYNKLLKMRNDYLKLLMTNNIADHRYLDIITDKLIDRAVYIYRKRFEFLCKINYYLDSIYDNITFGRKLKIVYEPNIDIKLFDDENIKKSLKYKYDSNLNKEMSLGMTIYGPHRDDFLFLIDDKNIEFFGSQGQQKLAVIALKLSFVYVLNELTNEMPILLLDDIFSEVDKKKKNKILEYIKNIGQVVITTNDIKDINKNKLDDVKIIKIKNQKITEKGGKNGR